MFSDLRKIAWHYSDWSQLRLHIPCQIVSKRFMRTFLHYHTKLLKSWRIYVQMPKATLNFSACPSSQTHTRLRKLSRSTSWWKTQVIFPSRTCGPVLSRQADSTPSQAGSTALRAWQLPLLPSEAEFCALLKPTRKQYSTSFPLTTLQGDLSMKHSFPTLAHSNQKSSTQ